MTMLMRFSWIEFELIRMGISRVSTIRYDSSSGFFGVKHRVQIGAVVSQAFLVALRSPGFMA